MNYQDYVKSELLVLVPVIYLIGIGLKKSKLPNKWIPIILGTISIALSAIWIVATVDIPSFKEIALAIFTAVTQGVLVAGTSVYVNQLYKQYKKEE